MERYGAEFFLEVIARRERLAPSSAEQALAAMLDELGARYERQRIMHGSARSYVLDFVLLPAETLIEVNGYWHRNTRLERDTELAKDWTRQIVFIDAEEIAQHPAAVKDLLARIIRE